MTEELIAIDNKDLVDIYGVNDENIQLLRKIFPLVKLVARGNELRVVGDRVNIDEFVAFFSRLHRHYLKYNKLNETDILQLLENGKDNNCLSDNMMEEDVILYGREGRVIRARSPNQLRLVKSIAQNDMVFAVGPAGTGKTYTAVALAVRALKNKEIRRIILTRPAVEAGENLGFLPGDLRDKLDPYLQPLYDALRDMIPPQRLLSYMEDKVIEIAPLAFMRGRTLDNAYVILDEAQNTTSMQLKMFLTRMGNNAKFFITGDLTQIDLPRNQSSGLLHAIHLLKDIKGIDVIFMNQSDIVRHRLVTSIVNAYEQEVELHKQKI
ncbi:MAG TPA: PhoH family protein [Bacteroidales bacterium]|jgi:phosphate starvation-inducible PhoH-like protein|nr:PhoH family protein [Bacteroidales bacterium]OQA85432.1 MAG: PhoH-like protein [Bacteroidetes bacterium ADurb.Bin234]HOS15829.1 PhoH family protein [Bacteroidales bacterium]